MGFVLKIIIMTIDHLFNSGEGTELNRGNRSSLQIDVKSLGTISQYSVTNLIVSLQSDQNIRRISDNMLIAVILGVFMFTVTQSHPSYKSRILNGNNVPDPCCPGRKWGRVGHTSPRDTALNNFGRVSKILFYDFDNTFSLSLSLSLSLSRCIF